MPASGSKVQLADSTKKIKDQDGLKDKRALVSIQGMSANNGSVQIKASSGGYYRWDWLSLSDLNTENTKTYSIRGWTGQVNMQEKVYQTAADEQMPGKFVGKLKLVVLPGNSDLNDQAKKPDDYTALHSSQGFSVAAIPVNWSKTKEANATNDLVKIYDNGDYRGMVVADSWQSDCLGSA